ncbi:unnamed protein product [Tuber melanosporum]|uniref:(Perigord truffle) hypothetical protein n=1 Tax=Tuber melanosporum (strain Mel28) TaxID=656061 RepID=D5G894_TUBMM|nr:uncharacterized protein GSTUM_00002937001 [Tuber melanosporum]CAZ80737.1 unnamed protein product [Tuber melanosporum]
MDEQWLSHCLDENMTHSAPDRRVYVSENYIIKKRLSRDENGHSGYVPIYSAVRQRDENEILALKLVQEHTSVPVPKVIHSGNGFTVFERFSGVTVDDKETWEKVTPKQREAIKLQVQGYIQDLVKIPHPSSGIRSLVPEGILFHNQLPYPGPFQSTQDFLKAYDREDVFHEYLIKQIDPHSIPVFSHFDWSLANIVLSPNMDVVIGVIDWERACFFPEAGRCVHRMCHKLSGWETLFDGMEFPKDVSGGGDGREGTAE